MTASRITKPQHSISIDAGLAPWEGRRLDTSEQIVREFKESYAAYKAAEARFKQSQATLNYAWAEGQLDGHQDPLEDGRYEFAGVTFEVAAGRKSYPIEAYSESTQALIKEERLNGAFRIGEKSLRPKFHD